MFGDFVAIRMGSRQSGVGSRQWGTRQWAVGAVSNVHKESKSVGRRRFAFSTAHCLLLTAYCLLLTAHCSLLTAYCLLPSGVPGTMVAVKLSLRTELPRLSLLGSSFVLFSRILKPASFEPLVTAPRQA
jgi:hypothetical protein